MRKLHWALASVGLFVLISGKTVLACSNTAEDCMKTNSCTGSPGAGSGGGGDAGVDACVPSQAAGAVDASCGVFASAKGDDSMDGSPESPVQTFSKAIALAAENGTKRVYACAEEFPEAVTVPAGIAIYGGLDCAASWSYIGDTAKTTIKPMADMVALTVTGGEGTAHIEDVTAQAADASIPGGSSIAAIVDGVTAEFVSCNLEAGVGREGGNGLAQEPIMPTNPDDPSIKGNSGMNACASSPGDTAGAEAKMNTVCSSAIGGAGGVGMVAGGGNGENGLPLPDPNPGDFGQGGAGAAALPCQPGGAGLPGADGLAGAGATGLGTLSKTGLAGAAGEDAFAGTPGQGGGGGGGAKGKTGCGGASGGSGGAGGCGGNGGKGGLAGGSSIALISLNASLSFTDVLLTAGAGGKGGEGGDGQFGGIGGTGGAGGALTAGTQKGCTGGEGGSGGSGGKGGGGRGGHSIGIAFMGTAPPDTGATVATGAAGEGGIGSDAAGSGQAGVKSDAQEF